QSFKTRYGLKKNVIIYLGQLNGAQYASLAINAFRTIMKKRNDTSLLVVGGGSMLDSLKEEAKDIESVVFTGFVKDEEVPLLLDVADIAVACFEENRITRAKSPLKIAEYLGSGKAIVASDVGEVPYMIGKAGVLVPPGDSEAIAEACLSLLSDPARMQKLRMNARKRAEKMFNWEHTAKNMLKSYSFFGQTPRSSAARYQSKKG
ncbi:MAG: glycosyltransferase family 4 protein, partial [Nanoarchaeota archaeon]|nr:glycosyltransferase family 4 protein [Nanoarchaeota archaeon]